jgi:hypothetical protein
VRQAGLRRGGPAESCVSVNRFSAGSFVQFNQEQKLHDPPYVGFYERFDARNLHIGSVYAQSPELFRGKGGVKLRFFAVLGVFLRDFSSVSRFFRYTMKWQPLVPGPKGFPYQPSTWIELKPLGSWFTGIIDKCRGHL